MVQVTASTAADGVTGEYRPQPATLEVPRLRSGGFGVAGIDITDDLERHDHLEQVRSGELASMHSWELVTGVDGPGTRMTVFLSGCPLRCLYCHNPDTFLMKDGAPVSDTELLSRIARYRRIFRTTNGGITLSGGEVLMQPQFAKRILMGAKEMGVHTCIDTSGFLGANCDDEMLDAIDLVLLDVKSGNEETYKKATGRSLAPTIEFGDRIAARGGATRIWIRFVLVPGLTDDPENVRQVGEIVSRWKDIIDRVEVLPFHQLGKDKWHSLGLEYQLEDTKAPTPEATEEVRNYFRSLGFLVH